MWIFFILIAAIGIGLIFFIAIKTNGWQVSENGNPTMVSREQRLTVFQRGAGWKFCAASVDGDDPPYFSDTYPTEEAAKQEALSFAMGIGPSHSTRKELRERQDRDNAPALLEQARKHVVEIEKALAHLKRRKTITPEQIERVAKRALSARDKTISIHHTLIDCGAPQEIKDEAGTFPMRLIDLRAEISAVSPKE